MGQLSRFASNIVTDFPGPKRLDWPEVATHELALCVEEFPQDCQLEAILKRLFIFEFKCSLRDTTSSGRT